MCVLCIQCVLCESSNDIVSTFWPDMAKNLARGLSDNWSQVCTYMMLANQYSHMFV